MRRCFFLGLVLTAAACAGPPEGVPVVAPTGAPTPEADVIERHAVNFEEDVPRRPPGSQQELAAATYVSGHLQAAGYVVQLDSVPVGDLVKSTNLIGVPPEASAPEVVVVVTYATAPDADGDGDAIAAFLEVARALMVARPGHDVRFAALGGQGSESGRGTTSLIELLSDLDTKPLVVVIDTSTDPDLNVSGTEGVEEFLVAARGANVPTFVGRGTFAGAFADAGFGQLTVAGPAPDVAAGLFEFLVSGPG